MPTLIADEAPAPSSPTTNGNGVNLLDLPDELLSLIFELHRDRLWDVDLAAGHSVTRLLLIQKSRIKPIVERLFSAYIDRPLDSDDPLVYYRRLLSRPRELTRAVRWLRLNLPVDDDAALVCADLVAQLPQLTYVFLSSRQLFDFDATPTLPLSVLQALGRLKNLTVLDLWDRFVLPRARLPPLPQLHTVKMYARSLDPVMATYIAAAQVRSLDLEFWAPSDASFEALPLSTVKELVIAVKGHFRISDVVPLFNKLRQQLGSCGSNLVLRTLTVDAECCSRAVDLRWLDSFRHASLRTLKLLFASARTLKFPHVELPHLDDLALSGQIDLTDPATLRELLAFLQRLPKLKVLDLRAETLYKTSSSRRVSSPGDLPSELSEDAPELRALVGCLQAKALVELRARTNASPSDQSFGLYTAKAERFLRWTRQGADFEPSVSWVVLFDAASYV